MNSSLRTKDLETVESLSLKTQESYKCSELETITFDIEKEWTFKKQIYTSGIIIYQVFLLSNIDVPALEYQSEGSFSILTNILLQTAFVCCKFCCNFFITKAQLNYQASISL